MSRDAYTGGSRSPRTTAAKLTTADRFLNRVYPETSIDRRSLPRSGNVLPDHRIYTDYYRKKPKTCSNCNYYKDIPSVFLLDRGRPLAAGGGGGGGCGGSADNRRYRSGARSLERYPQNDQQEQHEFLPGRERRERSLERFLFFDEDSYATRSAPQSPAPHQLIYENTMDIHRDLDDLKAQLELTDRKLGSSIHSLEAFFSPDPRRDPGLPFEESAKFSFINDALKILSNENQAYLTETLDRGRTRRPAAYRNLIIELLQTLLVLLYCFVVIVVAANKHFNSNHVFLPKI